MPTKKKAGKAEGRSRNSSASKGDAKAAPVEPSQAGAGESTRVTQASNKGTTTPAPKRARGGNAEKPRAKRDVTAKASTRGSRRRSDPVSAALSEAPPTREQIAARAYELFEKSGYQHGHSEEHWLQAERELKREYAAKKQAPGKPRPTFSSF
jgi:hypothetical protein